MSELKGNIPPKVFISYSWKPESNKQKVLDLAERLSSDGVYVVIDEWDLQDGQDKYVFMEQMVNDDSIDKVLLICNKSYADKSNKREGGVGIEGTIVSAEVYNNALQTKFIPIIFERDENGKEYVPIFLKQTIYVDLSQDESYEDNYEHLLRTIFNKPRSKRPPIGVMPAYLKEEKPSTLPTAHMVQKIATAIEKENRNINIYIEDYLQKFFIAFSSFIIEERNVTADNIIAIVDEKIQHMLPLKEDLLELIDILIRTQNNPHEFIVNFFERLLQWYENNDISLLESHYINGMCNDQFRYFNYDLFVSIITLLFKYENYGSIHAIIKQNFLVERKNRYEGVVEPVRYEDLRRYNHTLDDYKNRQYNLNRVSVTADYVKKNAVKVLFEEMVRIDILLYYLSLFYPSNNPFYQHWYPTLSCYNARRLEILPKLISKKYFEKVKILFEVNDKESLLDKLNGIKEPDGYRDAYNRIPSIKKGLCMDKLCSID